MPLALLVMGLTVFLVGSKAQAGEVAPPGNPGAHRQDAEVDEWTPVPVPEPSALAVRYHRTGNVVWLIARLWDVAVPLALVFSGLSARLRDVARRVASGWFVSTGAYVTLFLAVVYLADLPLKYYAGFVRPHAYGLSEQTLAKWSGDSLKKLAVEVAGGVCFAWVPFRVIARWPRRWWLVLGLLNAPFVAFVAMVAPVWIDPLYNDFGPMKDKSLEARILTLATRAGVSGGRVFEVNKSLDTKTANAYVYGLFGTKRIVLWDTLLKKFDGREVLVVTGHELGHYVLNHVAWGVALSSLVVTAGLFWTDQAGRWLLTRHARRFGFESLSDVAATPLILALMAVSYAALGPIALAYSRQNERAADRFALDLTHMNRSAALAFVDFQRENLSVPRPSSFYTIWRASHPSPAERIEFCNTYRPWGEAERSPPDFLRHSENPAPVFRLRGR